MITTARELNIDSPIATQVSFESQPDVEMPFESLANATHKIELLNVIKEDSKIIANVMVPDGKLETYLKKLDEYLGYKTNKNGQPIDNRKLIDSISALGAVRIEYLWADDKSLFPTNIDEEMWWEVWLPTLRNSITPIENFRKMANAAQIEVSESALEFPEHTVLLIKTSVGILSSSDLLLSQIAELRKAKETADFFDQVTYGEQTQFVDQLLQRTEMVDGEDVPYICILDTGINNGHPLLKPFLEDTDQHTTEPEWLTADDDGHGSGMAGLAIWGDISELLNEPNTQNLIHHKLESVKVLRHTNDNKGKHLGNITAKAIALPEITQPDRNRIFTMALSAKESMDRGKPSSWSSALDIQACDYLGENLNPRLIIVAAGNTGKDLVELKDYPQYNETQDIHDPAQSWNSLSVGGFTNKTIISEDDADDYRPLAPPGGLSPYSSTSVMWHSSMPIKPDIVFEAGNIGIDQTSCAGLSSLKLLTTDNEFLERQFTTFDATSAATALASKFSARLYSEYPSFWPETIRALTVHSASWTQAMVGQFKYNSTSKKQIAKNLVRRVGYGVPDLDRALWSANNSLAMIIEDEIQPFEKANNKISTRDMNIHSLPWPTSELIKLDDSDVTLTVTLSYFIEPNPSSRNISNKYRYPSHQLKFDVKRPTESMTEFKNRISSASHDDDHDSGGSPNDENWVLGEFRNRGSIHKDIWMGSAQDLANRGHIAVYPANGWWRTRTKLERFNKRARYSLVISLETPKTEVDLYTEIVNTIQTATMSTTEIEA